MKPKPKNYEYVKKLIRRIKELELMVDRLRRGIEIENQFKEVK